MINILDTGIRKPTQRDWCSLVCSYLEKDKFSRRCDNGPYKKFFSINAQNKKSNWLIYVHLKNAIKLYQCEYVYKRDQQVSTTATAPASGVEAVVRSPTNMAAAKIADVDFNKMTSLNWPACGHVRWGRSASQSTASNASAVRIRHKKSREYLICLWSQLPAQFTASRVSCCIQRWMSKCNKQSVVVSLLLTKISDGRCAVAAVCHSHCT